MKKRNETVTVGAVADAIAKGWNDHGPKANKAAVSMKRYALADIAVALGIQESAFYAIADSAKRGK
ncbi:MAG: hypothetical protein ACYTEQ_25605 [Planctomycetota bacterium]|jgi:hypothetical protein